MAFIKRSVVEQISIIKDDELSSATEELKEKFDTKTDKEEFELKKDDKQDKVLN
jgi:hypothetical protein